MTPYQQLQTDLNRLANPQKAKNLARFFKTGKDEYGEGDQFLGIVVPLQRQVVTKYWKEITLDEVNQLLESPIHEVRLVALLILVKQYHKANPQVQEQIFNLYLEAAANNCINNWDLVDLTAGHIVGAYLDNKDKTPLTTLARSNNLWQRRIAIIATFYFIMHGQPEETLRIATILVHDKHDLIHKAVGWMLREVGKRCNQEVEEQFLNTYAPSMPRTMLRYAIERFPEEKRRYYLNLGKTPDKQKSQ